MVVGRL